MLVIKQTTLTIASRGEHGALGDYVEEKGKAGVGIVHDGTYLSPLEDQEAC